MSEPEYIYIKGEGWIPQAGLWVVEWRHEDEERWRIPYGLGAIKTPMPYHEALEHMKSREQLHPHNKYRMRRV